MVTYPTYAKRVSLATIQRTRNFDGMHPTVRDRIERLMVASGGKVGWGQGLRTDQQQLQLFLSRYEPDPGGPVSWDGKRWSRVRGAPATPPGRSMHGIGLAADLVGDFDWLGDHAAEFDLLTFADVNDEPWHVQPVELAKSRRDYESAGSAWGAHPSYTVDGATVSVGASPQAGAGEGSTPTLTPALEVEPGDEGPAVRVLHEVMIARGLLPDAAPSRDRAYDDADEQLVRTFQTEHELVVDGMVGPQTWGALLEPIEPDASGAMVRTLQTTLIVRRMISETPANLDGLYGSATQARIREFQQVSGLVVDAVVGPNTWTALLGVKRPIAIRDRGLDPLDEVVDLDDLDLLTILDGLAAS